MLVLVAFPIRFDFSPFKKEFCLTFSFSLNDVVLIQLLMRGTSDIPDIDEILLQQD